MTRYLFGFLCVCALGVMPLVGCSDTGGDGGSGGAAGSGGSGGTGGMPECQSPEDCDDANDCTGNACTDGMCEHTPLANGATCDESNECTTGTCADGECDTTSLADGTACGNGAGTCEAGSCVGVFACTEQGIRDAIAVGGGPHTFDCNGPTTVVTVAEIVIDNNVILDGEGKLTVDGGGGHADPLDDHRVFQVSEGVSATLDGLAVSEGFGSWFDYKQFGAGIWNAGTLTLTNSTVLGNTAVTIGGGIYNVGTLTLVNSTVSGNVANSGGGILSEVGTLTLTNSTVSGNTVEGGCGEGICGCGGIWNINGGTLTLTNSTVSGNTGGGIWNMNESVATVVNSTVSENGDENIFIQDSGLTFTSSLIAGPCLIDRAISNGYNIESPGNTCGFDQQTDQVNVPDPMLGPLQDNGGPTMTHALGPGSVAIDHIPAVDCVDADGAPLTTDQRGVTRPQGDACDVGAVEMEVTP